MSYDDLEAKARAAGPEIEKLVNSLKLSDSDWQAIYEYRDASSPDVILGLLARLRKLEAVVDIARKQQETTYYGMSDWQVEASDRMREALRALEDS